MTTKVAIVTGANKGIGYAIVKHLCLKFDGVVYLTARDEQRGKAAVEALRYEGVSPVFYQLDIDSESSIAKFRDFIQQTHGGIDILVNNTAIAYKSYRTIFGKSGNTNRVNVFGTMNVSDQLFPWLKNHARVVHVSSSAGHLLRINGDEPGASKLRSKFASPNLTQSELKEMVDSFIRLTKQNKHMQHGWPNSAYAVSKVAVSALTRIHQRKFDKNRQKDIVVNCCHPGYVNTDMTSGRGHLTIDEGCQAPVFLALLPPNINEPRGAYVLDNKLTIDWVNGPTPGAV